MLRAIGLAVVVLGLFWASEAWGQIYYHADGRGYTNRIGNTTFENYNDGRIVTRTQIGDLHTYRDNRGGYGSTFYGPIGTQRSFGNTQTGRTFNSFTPSYPRPLYVPPMYQPYRSPYGW